MLKKIVIAVVAGSLLSPVGFAFSKTGGRGLARGGSSYCSHKARAAGGSQPACTTTSRTTITAYRTVRRPVTTTKTSNRYVTTTVPVTHTVNTTVGSTTYVDKTVIDVVKEGDTVTTTLTTTTTSHKPGNTATLTTTSTAVESTEVTSTTTTTAVVQCVFDGDSFEC
jgi:hypothetical protein